MRWQDKLAAEERKHLRSTKIFSLKDFRELRKFQVMNMISWAGNTDIPTEIRHGCMDCRKIAEKLGV